MFSFIYYYFGAKLPVSMTELSAGGLCFRRRTPGPDLRREFFYLGRIIVNLSSGSAEDEATALRQ